MPCGSLKESYKWLSVHRSAMTDQCCGGLRASVVEQPIAGSGQEPVQSLGPIFQRQAGCQESPGMPVWEREGPGKIR
jgi:hypothetical protein